LLREHLLPIMKAAST